MSNIPKWNDLSHHERYLLLNSNRQTYCEKKVQYPTNQKRSFTLDGTYILDVPSFYLSIGEAINGVNGYFGACLDSLSDCLSGGCGVEDVIDVSIINAKNIEDNLNHSAWIRFKLEQKLSIFEDGYLPCSEHLIEIGVCDPIEVGEKTYTNHLYEILGGRFKIYD